MTERLVRIGTPCEEHGCTRVARYRVRYLTSPVMQPSFEFCAEHAADRVELSETDLWVTPVHSPPSASQNVTMSTSFGPRPSADSSPAGGQLPTQKGAENG